MVISATTVIDTEAIRDAIIAGLAVAENVAPGDVEDAIGRLGSDDRFEIESKTAEFVCAYVEHALGLDVRLPTPCDLGREQFATVAALTGAIAEFLNATSEFLNATS
jgi:hypothetical protein